MIPTELAFLIVENLTPKDAPTLARLARCSSTFHSICIPRLYNHIHIHNHLQFVRLLQGLSVQVDGNGEPLPCPTLTELAVSHTHDQEEPPLRLYGTRKLAQLRLTRHVTLHCFPDTHMIDTVSQPSGHTLVQIDGDSGPLLKPVKHLFPSVQGIILGKRFIRRTARYLSKLQPCDSDGDCFEETHDSVQSDSFRPYSNGLFPSPKTCYGHDNIPNLGCFFSKLDLHRYLASNKILDLNISTCNIHSTSNADSLHSSISPAPEASRMRYHVDVSNDPDIEKVWDDLCSHGSALEIETFISSDKPTQRRDIVMSGLSESQIRAFEDKFVAEIEMSSEHEVTIDREDSLAALSRLGAPDPGAERVQGRKRVVGIDFIHAPSAAHCVCCGKGGGGGGGGVAQLSGFSVDSADMWYCIE